jgi:STE24 endopeptidase
MRFRCLLATMALAFAVLLCAGLAPAQQSPGPGAKPATAMPDEIPIPAAAQPSDHFNPDAATEAYLAEIPATARSRSDAYFVGGYWLTLWDFLYASVMYLLILHFGWSAAMRDFAARITRFKPLQTLVYFAEFTLITTIVGAPLAIYEGYFRERQYSLGTQTFGPWLGDQMIILCVNTILGGLLAVALMGIVRRLQRTWWVWGALVSIAFFAFFVAIAPVVFFPLLNKYTVLENPKITQPILSLARANGISAQKVYEVDASRQTTRMSANVSGLGNTMRITLNDNLIKRASLEEIQSIMGHEMGHYVLHHISKDILYFAAVTFLFFAFLYFSLERSLARWGQRWRVSGITDTAVIPLVFLLATIFGFVYTPFMNTHIRTNEHEADMYGLNASRQPDGFARAAIHLGEYRKMSPTPLEEWLFFDHPSGRNRIHDAMQWKAENLQLLTPQPAATPQSAPPQKEAAPKPGGR